MERIAGCAVVIPARDEAGAIGTVVAAALLVADLVVVVDNGSRDLTGAVAAAAGARVVREPRRGYGHACLAGVAAVGLAEMVVFVDGDGSMPIEEIPRLVAPIRSGTADVVCGSRTALREPGSMPWHQACGNALALLLLRALYGVRLTDLGPYRAVRGSTLRALSMPGSRFAWPASLLARAARRGARICEVQVGYRRRVAGRSKVSGNLRGSVEAGAGIVATLLWQRVSRR
ncbi:MAG TPA: glycosyltransferase [Candidatus Angelobacter sp.]|jgi:glycosyltransferase involved in cell wall biosynthesis|nr:glycosyltransferase [Candidatus Angelobacter sp.]